jgi:hypothetical protein
MEGPKEFQRWTAKRKVDLLLQLIRGETKFVDACREHDLKQSEVDAARRVLTPERLKTSRPRRPPLLWTLVGLALLTPQRAASPRRTPAASDDATAR